MEMDDGLVVRELSTEYVVEIDAAGVPTSLQVADQPKHRRVPPRARPWGGHHPVDNERPPAATMFLARSGGDDRSAPSTSSSRTPTVVVGRSILRASPLSAQANNPLSPTVRVSDRIWRVRRVTSRLARSVIRRTAQRLVGSMILAAEAVAHMMGTNG